MIFIQSARQSLGKLGRMLIILYLRLTIKHMNPPPHVMHMILYHLKVALRNLTKYKLQDLYLGTEHRHRHRHAGHRLRS